MAKQEKTPQGITAFEDALKEAAPGSVSFIALGDLIEERGAEANLDNRLQQVANPDDIKLFLGGQLTADSLVRRSEMKLALIQESIRQKRLEIPEYYTFRIKWETLIDECEKAESLSYHNKYPSFNDAQVNGETATWNRINRHFTEKASIWNIGAEWCTGSNFQSP
jgi:hypothetical protein